MTCGRRTCWRCDEQVMCPTEPASSISGASPSPRRWTGCSSPAPPGTHSGLPRGPPKADVDAQKTAVLILAALRGGSTLSRIAQDPRPLNAALDLALVPCAGTEDHSPARTGDELPA